MSFVHLHTHTQFSLLDGSNKITEYVAKVKSLGMNAAAITDHGVMYGVIDFYKEAKKAGINPVLGCEVYVAPGSRFDKEKTKGEAKYYHLILLAENNVGYSNLMQIVTAGFVDGYYYKPRVDFEILERFSEGIICLSACIAGEVAVHLRADDYEGAKEAARRHLACFGEGNYFLELQDHGMAEQKKVNAGLLRLSKETGIPLVATNDCHYTQAEDAKAHDILLCIQTGKRVGDEDRMKYEGGQFYVKSEEEMRALFPYAGEALDNTQKIADRCRVEIEFGVTKLPHFEVPEGYTSWSYLNKLCFDGLERRYGNRGDGAEKAGVDGQAGGVEQAGMDGQAGGAQPGVLSMEKLKERLSYELDVIRSMGYVDYFLIVWDFINYAREHGIPVGPGRGSAAGSMVSYTTGITNIDPIRYQLLFERFLNPERVSMPDIDVDFCFNRRGEVIDYVVEKYGADCVTQIVTFGTMAARNAIRDVGRAMDLPYGYVDKIAKSIPAELNITIEKALRKNPDLRAIVDAEPDAKELIDMSMKLEGLPRHTSMHAAGVVISQRPMVEFVPLARASDGKTIVTQFPMTTIEELGLLKMDFLGLRTLTVIQDAVRLIQEDTGKRIDVESLDEADAAVFEMISSGNTSGVFQLESQGMTNFMRELRPGSLEDVIAGISLFRPGPMDFIPDYIRGKNGDGTIHYLCPQLEPILSPTYGCIVYQEQVMQIVRDLAGYSLGRSDLVRRAMSKKKESVMQQERKNFVFGNPEEQVPGCISNGIDEATANKIFDQMTDFAKYAFNKSHAACYAVVAYQTAWLKLYYPLEFFAALLTSVIDKNDKVAEYISVCRGSGIEVLPPSVSVGEGRFSVSEARDSIRYGLMAIKSVGKGDVERILENRRTLGPFRDFEDFLRRSVDMGLNKRTLENLIKAGALDGLGANRRQMAVCFHWILSDIEEEKKKTLSGQFSLFDLAGEAEKEELRSKLPELSEYERRDFLGLEKEVLGVYLSGHPLEEDAWMLEKLCQAVSRDFIRQSDEEPPKVRDGEKTVVGGMIAAKTVKYTKNGNPMAFLDLEDLEGTMEIIVFPNVYEKSKFLLEEDQKVLIPGRVSIKEESNASLIAEDLIPFEEIPREVWLKFAGKHEYLERSGEVETLFPKTGGRDYLVIYLEQEHRVKRAKGYSFSEERKKALAAAFGAENVGLKYRLA